MTSLPETKYAKSGDISIAYQVMGDGPIDLVIVPGTVHHVEFLHEIPGYTRFVGSLAAFARVITFDKRGGGLSDPITGAPSLEERMDDVRAVVDAVGSQRIALLGWSEGGSIGALFAATYPERTAGLVLYHPYIRLLWSPDFPSGLRRNEVEQLIEAVVDSWGQGNSLAMFEPSLAENHELRALWGKLERLSLSPGAVRAVWQLNAEIDVRSVLPAIRVPTLTVDRREPRGPLASARDVADQIPGTRFVELDGAAAWPFLGDTGAFIAVVEEFLTGHQHVISSAERVLATVLFTDIVGSTEHAAKVGDKRWRQILDDHDELVLRQVERFRGSLVKHTGDGVLTTFDGPARAINCANAIRDGARALGLEIRAGLHIGEVELRDDDIGGIAVHIAARVLEKAEPGEVLVSRTLTDLVAGSGLRFEDRGEHELKGVAEKWQLFAAV